MSAHTERHTHTKPNIMIQLSDLTLRGVSQMLLTLSFCLRLWLTACICPKPVAMMLLKLGRELIRRVHSNCSVMGPSSSDVGSVQGTRLAFTMHQSEAWVCVRASENTTHTDTLVSFPEKQHDSISSFFLSNSLFFLSLCSLLLPLSFFPLLWFFKSRNRQVQTSMGNRPPDAHYLQLPKRPTDKGGK